MIIARLRPPDLIGQAALTDGLSHGKAIQATPAATDQSSCTTDVQLDQRLLDRLLAGGEKGRKNVGREHGLVGQLRLMFEIPARPIIGPIDE